MLSDDQCAALINQGLAALQAGNGESAWLLLQTARDSGCRQAQLHIGFGGLYEQLGEWTKAHAAFDYAIQVDPDLAQGYNNRGRILAMLDQLDDAMADFEQAFITGTAVEVTPISQIGDYTFEVGDMTKNMVHDYDDLVNNRQV